MVCRTTGLGFAAVARVTEERWIACAVRDEIAFGLEPGSELQVATTICNEIRQGADLVVIDQAAEDPAFSRHPAPQRYGFESYISVPITLADGRFFGTLCALDPRPARINTPATVTMFKLFAELIASHLDAHERLAISEGALLRERHQAELRDQFIAVLGHDLRNPLAAVHTAATVLQTMTLPEQAARMTGIIKNGARRMAGLIDNVMDFTRVQLGGGLPLNVTANADLATIFEQVVAEARVSSPRRTIASELAIPGGVTCDPERVGQLLSNLVANALTHGDPASAVTVRAAVVGGAFEASVANAGEPIAGNIIGRLFQPFVRGADRRDLQGLGLGLYIASEIARAHGGSLDVTSTPDETRFTFRFEPATVPAPARATAAAAP